MRMHFGKKKVNAIKGVCTLERKINKAIIHVLAINSAYPEAKNALFRGKL